MAASKNPRWIDAFVLIGAGLFIVALTLSAVFDPTIRALHTLQALIYIAVITSTRRAHPMGFGAGTFVAAFWNYINLFVTTFIRAGLGELVVLLQTGQVRRPDLLVAVIAGAGHFMLIAACAIGFLRHKPGPRQWGQFLVGGALSIAYFIAIILVTGPQYIGLMKRAFGLS